MYVHVQHFNFIQTDEQVNPKAHESCSTPYPLSL